MARVQWAAESWRSDAEVPGLRLCSPGPAAARQVLALAGSRAASVKHAASRNEPCRSASRLQVRQLRRLPHGLGQREASALLESFRSWRDRAIAGLMRFCGLRSAEVLGLAVEDVDIGRRWVRVMGKGGKERRVPMDEDVAGAVQTYLLAERPDTRRRCCSWWARSQPGRPLTPAGLRTVFRYHRTRSGVAGGHPSSRPGARFRCCHRPVSPDRSPNPPCRSLGNGLPTASAIRRGSWLATGWGCPGSLP